MKRSISSLLAALALVAGSCGGPAATAPGPGTTTVEVAGSSSTPSTTGSEIPPTTAGVTPPNTSPGPSFDGPAAPDFELALDGGSRFVLSDEVKPVYLVFWAEW